MAVANITPRTADRLIVAVDFVSYFMKKIKPDLKTIFQDFNIGSKAYIRRKISHMLVSEDMQDVLKSLDETESDLVRKDFDEFNKDLISKDSLTDFSRKYYDAYIIEGINIGNFSKYAARTAAMASYFYNNGMLDAPDVAVELIITSFPDYPDLNWSYLDFANKNEESSNDSKLICESDSSSDDKFQLSEECLETVIASITPHTADRLIVAVDVVSYFMKKMKPDLTTIFQDFNIGSKAYIRRKLSHMAVSDDMQDLLKVLDATQSDIVRKDFEEFVNTGLASKDSLIYFARKYRDALCDKEITLANFSMYCARIAIMASFFYDKGMMDAPDLAAKLIIYSFPDDPNLKWTYLDFANKTNTEEISKFETENYTIRELAGIISSVTKGSSHDSVLICESDSSSNDQFHQSEGHSEPLSTSSSSVELEYLSTETSELRVSNLEHTSAVTEQAGGFSSLAQVPVTRSSSVSPRKKPSPKEESSHSPSKSSSTGLTEPSSSIGKSRSAGNDDIANPNVVAESAAEKDYC